MEKILLAVDSMNTDETTTAFACHLARLTQSRLTAVFLEQPVEETTVFIGTTGGPSAISVVDFNERPSPEVRQANIDRFRRIAGEEDIAASVYLDKGVPSEEIIAESRFADLLVVNGSTSFSALPEPSPSAFIRSILQEAGCPVVIAPAIFEGFGNIVFCYDGSKSSIFAMKQFTYLFPQLRAQRAKIIYLSGGEVLLPKEQSRITEWLKCHYADAEWIIEEPESTAALFNYLFKKRNDFVVMGAYGKGLLASFFQSTDPEEPPTVSLPIFVTHH